MAKSTKKVRNDGMTQRESNRAKKDKRHVTRNDANRWGDKIMKKLKALEENENE